MDYSEGTAEMVKLCAEMAEAYHPDLDGARIAIICRDTASKVRGKTVLATASKPTSKMLPLLREQYDYIICIALDTWHELTEAQQKALIDHELCHCGKGEDGTASLIPHDLEEFACIIERHGMWRQDGTESAVRDALLFRQKPMVEAPRLKFAANE